MGGARIWERWVAAVLFGCLGVLLIANAAEASKVSVGNLTIDFELDSAPRALPRLEDAPIRFWGSSSLRTRDGSIPPPLQHLMFEADKYGHLETRGLPTCSRRKLAATTSPQARKLCPGAIVGSGFGSGVVAFPEQAPIPASSPITFFNGPEIDGDPSVIVHAHLDIPAPTTYLVPVRIESIDNGIYGFRAESDVPPIAGGYGSITDFRFQFNRRWNFKGEQLSYVNARCEIGRLQGLIEAEFADGTKLHSSFVHTCRVR